MSDDDAPETTDSPVVRDRRGAVRAKAQQVHTRQSRARIARRSGLGVLAAGAVAAVAIVVVSTVAGMASAPKLSPSAATDDGFAVADVVAGSVADSVESAPEAPAPDAAAETAVPAPTASTAPPVDIRVYVDYLSEGARQWQLANSSQLTSWVDDGAVTLSYYPVAMLTAKSNGTKYSLRAAGAAACVATHSPDSFFAFNNDLLVRQPAIDTDGYSDTQLAEMAIATGADQPKVVRDCIEAGDYAAWAKDATERAVAGIPGAEDVALTRTPMILVNGEPYVGELDDPAEFSQFVMTSASDEFYRSVPTPTPTATPAP